VKEKKRGGLSDYGLIRNVFQRIQPQNIKCVFLKNIFFSGSFDDLNLAPPEIFIQQQKSQPALCVFNVKMRQQIYQEKGNKNNFFSLGITSLKEIGKKG